MIDHEVRTSDSVLLSVVSVLLSAHGAGQADRTRCQRSVFFSFVSLG